MRILKRDLLSVGRPRWRVRAARFREDNLACGADAILRRDYPVIQGVVLLFSFTYVVVNLIVDLLYTLFDPRIRY